MGFFKENKFFIKGREDQDIAMKNLRKAKLSKQELADVIDDCDKEIKNNRIKILLAGLTCAGALAATMLVHFAIIGVFFASGLYAGMKISFNKDYKEFKQDIYAEISNNDEAEFENLEQEEPVKVAKNQVTKHKTVAINNNEEIIKEK